MGDRANVKIKDGESEVFLYTHWLGSSLPKIVQRALLRGKDQWDDGPYLARIIFCEMLADGSSLLDATTGFGISSVIGDGDDQVLTIDVQKQTVSANGKKVSFGYYLDEPLTL